MQSSSLTDLIPLLARAESEEHPDEREQSYFSMAKEKVAVCTAGLWAYWASLGQQENPDAPKIEKMYFNEREKALKYLALTQDQDTPEEIRNAYEKVSRVVEQRKTKLPPIWHPAFDTEIKNFQRARDFLLVQND